MKYPDDFNTPAFPAGKFVAVSRFMATAVMVIFFLIVCLCGIILWVKKTQDVSPFLISFQPNGERWTMVAYNNHKKEIPAYYVVQESLVYNFARNWFTISTNPKDNQQNWANCSQTPEVCTETTGRLDSCTIFCNCDHKVFDSFEKVVLPTYNSFGKGVSWVVKNISVAPLYSAESIAKTYGIWKLNVLVDTGMGTATFVGYAHVKQDEHNYPKTMGYYISDFNTYRMN